MYIRKTKEELTTDGAEKNKSNFFRNIVSGEKKENNEENLEDEEVEQERLGAPHDMLIAENSGNVFLHWQAPEFENFEVDKKIYLYAIIFLIALIAYAIFTDSILMAILFILIGVVGYIYINKEPRILNFMITRDGIVAEKEIYDFDNLKSFWIIYEPEDICVISLHTESYLTPYVQIPIHNEDPVEIREILLNYIPEEKHEPGVSDLLGRLLGL